MIKRMLASLGDPYTRFLSPDEVIHWHEYMIVTSPVFQKARLKKCELLS